MALLLPSNALRHEDNDDVVVATPLVKNTFITWELPTPQSQTRRRSVPASSKLCSHGIGHLDLKLHDSQSFLSDSTYEAMESASGTRTPMSDDYDFDLLSFALPQEAEVYPQEAWCGAQFGTQRDCPFPELASAPPPPPPPPPRSEPCRSKLSSRAAFFQPQSPLLKQESMECTECMDKSYNNGHKLGVSDFIYLFRDLLLQPSQSRFCMSEQVKGVEISEDEDGWMICLQPGGSSENLLPTELALSLAKEALLEAVGRSKSVYVMGYCSPKPFDERPLGFTATLGVMASAKSACWHVFKKGFCRHASECCKQHPVLQVPVRFLVEGAQCDFSTPLSTTFTEQVADLVSSVAATLQGSGGVDRVAAIQDEDYHGWTIKVSGKVDLATCKEYLLHLAKNVIYTASSSSVYIIGYAEKPFLPKPNGFAAVLGSMRSNESSCCWEYYSKGTCSKGGRCEDHGCFWEHPDCLLTINVVLEDLVFQ